ncbi:hypothetical protein P885DRAFT_43372 [Corynascus similis CBS 632.67]
MQRPQMLGKTMMRFLFLAVSSLLTVQANKGRRDLCGVSVHASDIPDIGNFSVIDATWRVPDVVPERDEFDRRAPYISQGVALCCGDDCSTRLAAGTWASPRDSGHSSSASAMFQLSPVFGPFLIPAAHHFEFNSSDVLRTRVEILEADKAQLTFSKFQNATSHTIITVDLGIRAEKDGTPILNIATRGNGRNLHFAYSPRYPDAAEKPVFCGDSAWWYVSDNFDPGDEMQRRRRPLADFSPVLMASHGLRTVAGRRFPADLPLSGLARFWNMVRDGNGGSEVLCTARGFVDTGMTMLQARHPWGV